MNTIIVIISIIILIIILYYIYKYVKLTGGGDKNKKDVYMFDIPDVDGNTLSNKLLLYKDKYDELIKDDNEYSEIINSKGHRCWYPYFYQICESLGCTVIIKEEEKIP